MTVTATLLDSRYLLDEEIGTGGFCEVWRATDTLLGRQVAVKLLHAGYAGQPEARARLAAEARQAGGLAHGNVARVYDYGEPACGRPYLVMELIEGPSLTTVLAGGPLKAARTMDIVAQVADGLQAAHSAGLAHRDIKPANILFTPDGTARITDFGIAHAAGSAPLTATGTVMGTPGYIAPERVAGAAGGPASDLYALGIVAFECLAGAPPFSGPPLEVAIAHRDRPLPPLPASVPAEVAEFVMALTAKDPARRPASAREAGRQARRLRDCLVPGATGALPAPAGARPAITSGPGTQGGSAVHGQARNRWPRHPPVMTPVAVAALGVLALLMLLTASWFAPAADPAQPSLGHAHQAAPPVTNSPSMTSPATSRPAGHPPPATARADAAVSHKPARHHAPPPVRDSHGNRYPGHGHGAPHGPGNGQAALALSSSP